jgi:hypothetical protein
MTHVRRFERGKGEGKEKQNYSFGLSRQSRIIAASIPPVSMRRSISGTDDGPDAALPRRLRPVQRCRDARP